MLIGGLLEYSSIQREKLRFLLQSMNDFDISIVDTGLLLMKGKSLVYGISVQIKNKSEAATERKERVCAYVRALLIYFNMISPCSNGESK